MASATRCASPIVSGSPVPRRPAPVRKRPGTPAIASSSRATRAPWPTSICGVPWGHRNTLTRTGVAAESQHRAHLAPSQLQEVGVRRVDDAAVVDAAEEDPQHHVSLGHAAFELGGMEAHGRGAQVLVAGDEQAVALEAMGHVLAPVADDEHDGRGEPQAGQERAGLGGSGSDERRRGRCGQGQDRRAERASLTGFELQGKAAVDAAESTDRAPRAQRALRQARRESLDELPEAALEGSERGRKASGGRRRGGAQAAHDASVALLEGRQPGEGGPKRKALGVSRVNAREEGLGDPLEHLRSESAAHERRDRLVLIAPTRGSHEVETHAELASPREERAREDGGDPRGHREGHAFGQRKKSPAPKDEDRARPRVRGHQPVGEAQRPDEGQRLRLLHQEAVGSALDEEAAVVFGADHATQALAGFEELEAVPALVEGEGGAEPGDPTSHHRDRGRGLGQGHGVWAWTCSTTAFTFRTSVPGSMP